MLTFLTTTTTTTTTITTTTTTTTTTTQFAAMQHNHHPLNIELNFDHSLPPSANPKSDPATFKNGSDYALWDLCCQFNNFNGLENIPRALVQNKWWTLTWLRKLNTLLERYADVADYDDKRKELLGTGDFNFVKQFTPTLFHCLFNDNKQDTCYVGVQWILSGWIETSAKLETEWNEKYGFPKIYNNDNNNNNNNSNNNNYNNNNNNNSNNSNYTTTTNNNLIIPQISEELLNNGQCDMDELKIKNGRQLTVFGRRGRRIKNNNTKNAPSISKVSKRNKQQKTKKRATKKQTKKKETSSSSSEECRSM